MSRTSVTSTLRHLPLRPVALAAAAALLAGCSLIPAYQAQRRRRRRNGLPRPAPARRRTAAADLPWQDFVQDAQLRELISLALANNRDLRVAVQNIEARRRTADPPRRPGAQFQRHRRVLALGAFGAGGAVLACRRRHRGRGHGELGDRLLRPRRRAQGTGAGAVPGQRGGASRPRSAWWPTWPVPGSRLEDRHRTAGPGRAHAGHAPADAAAHQTAFRQRRLVGARSAPGRIAVRHRRRHARNSSACARRTSTC